MFGLSMPTAVVLIVLPFLIALVQLGYCYWRKD